MLLGARPPSPARSARSSHCLRLARLSGIFSQPLAEMLSFSSPRTIITNRRFSVHIRQSFTSTNREIEHDSNAFEYTLPFATSFNFSTSFLLSSPFPQLRSSLQLIRSESVANELNEKCSNKKKESIVTEIHLRRAQCGTKKYVYFARRSSSALSR